VATKEEKDELKADLIPNLIPFITKEEKKREEKK
jgi:hypothetical protein